MVTVCVCVVCSGASVSAPLDLASAGSSLAEGSAMQILQANAAKGGSGGRPHQRAGTAGPPDSGWDGPATQPSKHQRTRQGDDDEDQRTAAEAAAAAAPLSTEHRPTSDDSDTIPVRGSSTQSPGQSPMGLPAASKETHRHTHSQTKTDAGRNPHQPLSLSLGNRLTHSLW